MDSGFRPIGSALPARRISARAAEEMNARNARALADSIVVPSARDRLHEQFERVLMPADVKGILAEALSGDLENWSKLVQAMFDTWPRLQKNIGEIQRAARKAAWQVLPFAERHAKPTPEAEEIAKEVEHALWGTRPDVTRAEQALEGLIERLTLAYFTGLTVDEIRWRNTGECWTPRAFKQVPARFYGYAKFGEDEDRLLFKPDGNVSATVEEFPANRFVIGMRTGHAGHPLVSAPIRVLTGYWLAAVFGLQWFIQYAQLFGVPFRWASYADKNAKAEICQMMQRIGSEGYAVVPEKTQINFAQPAQHGADLPQRELLSLADEQCDTFILGQTLTTSVGESGSRALGEVHEGIRRDVIEGVCDFIGVVISSQVIPAYLRVNYGTEEEAPTFFARFEQARDGKAHAERMDVLVNRIGLPMETDYVYQALGVPRPAQGAEIFQRAAADDAEDFSGEGSPGKAKADGAQGDPATGDGDAGAPHETKRTPQVMCVELLDEDM